MDEKGTFILAKQIIKSAVEMPRGTKRQRLEVIEMNKEFADSKLVKMFCDCTDNFEAGKLSKWIKDKNDEMKEMILNEVLDQRKRWFDK